MTAPMSLRWAGRNTLVVTGEVDMSNTDMLATAASKRAGGHLVLDLIDCTFMDSMGLKAVIELRDGLQLTLRIMDGSIVDRLLDLTRLEDAFEIDRVSER